MRDCLSNGQKVLFAGNGGSAADSLHLAAEFVGRFRKDRRPLPAVSLAADSAALTAIGNDYGFVEVFARQVAALGSRGDVLFVMSTSARSANVIEAIRRARSLEMHTLALVGAEANELGELCSVVVGVNSHVASHIQEAHIAVGHALCMRLEEELDLLD
jgi:D-sedoheptulose 7-phosphate isomerase